MPLHCSKCDTSVICHQMFTCCLLASHNICWAHWIRIQPIMIQGAFYWNYSVDSYSGIRITENTEYQFPKENTDVLTWQKLGRRDRGSLGTQFSRRKTGENCQTNTITGCSVYSKQTAIPAIPPILLLGIDGLLIRSFCVFSFRNSIFSGVLHVCMKAMLLTQSQIQYGGVSFLCSTFAPIIVALTREYHSIAFLIICKDQPIKSLRIEEILALILRYINELFGDVYSVV